MQGPRRGVARIKCPIGRGPAFSDFFVHHFQQRVPHPCVFFCKGGRQCSMRYLIFYDATGINKLVLAFPIPALRNEREGRGTHCVADASEFTG